MPKGKAGRTIISKTCVVCGGTFERVKGRNEATETCSSACRGKLYSQRNRRQEERECPACGGKFIGPASQKYCSRTCMYRRNDAAFARTCEVCGKPFRVRSSTETTRTCSLECGFKLRVVPSKGMTYVEVRNGQKVRKMHRWAANVYNGTRRAAKLQATPKWASLEKVQALYKEAQTLSKLAGMPYHVDHIVPLIHKRVCGLHNEFNLQVLPGPDNLSKGNRYWPDM